MRRFVQWLVAGYLFAGASIQARAQATINGTVQLLKPGAAAVSSARYQNKNIPVVAPAPWPAVIYLEGSFPALDTNAAPTIQMSQKNLQFTPSVLPVRKGTLIEFPNQDDEYHNVLSYSKAKSFDVGRYRKDEKTPAVKFDKVGAVDLNCEIHEHMSAIILVLDTPYFTTSDTNGVYQLRNLPAGKYTLKAWLNTKTTRSQPVELKDGQTLEVNFPAP